MRVSQIGTFNNDTKKHTIVTHLFITNFLLSNLFQIRIAVQRRQHQPFILAGQQVNTLTGQCVRRLLVQNDDLVEQGDQAVWQIVAGDPVARDRPAIQAQVHDHRFAAGPAGERIGLDVLERQADRLHPTAAFCVTVARRLQVEMTRPQAERAMVTVFGS